MTDLPTAPSPSSPRLSLSATLGDAIGALPRMARGAGGVLVLAFASWVGVVYGPAMGASGGFGVVLIVWAILIGLVGFGAITRIGVADDLAQARQMGLGPGGFQMTRVEARLLGAGALCALFLIIILSLLALVALALFGGAGLNAQAVRAGDWAAAGPAWKLGMLAFVGLIVLGAPIVLAVRLSLFAPATVGRGQMISLTATALTNGAMVPLFAGLVACALPTWIWIAAAAGGLMGNVGAALWLAVFWGLQAPLTAAFLGAAYRRLETHAMLGAWQ